MQLKLYAKLINISLKSAMSHRISFLMLSFSFFIESFIQIVGLWILFDRFKNINGWNLNELIILYCVINIGFEISATFARSFHKFSIIIKHGEFDRILLRPLGSLFQVSTQMLQLERIGALIQVFIIFIIGCINLKIQIFSYTALILFLSIINTACLFSGIFIIQATSTFWTIESLELINIISYGGRDAGQFPITIYSKWFRYFFTFIIPLSCVAYYPIATELGHEFLNWKINLIATCSGFIFLYLSCQLWKIGVNHYRSTGN